MSINEKEDSIKEGVIELIKIFEELTDLQKAEIKGRISGMYDANLLNELSNPA